MSQDDRTTQPGAGAGDEVSQVLERWGAAETLDARLASRFGPGSLAGVELEREEQPAADRVRELLESLHLRGGAFGRYRVKDEIGRGGMGVVLRLWDAELKRHLAMKIALATHDRPEARHVARFLEEAQVTAQLDHPGIVPVHELGLDSEGRVYFTMRLVKGRSLGEVFELTRRQREGWTESRVLGVLIKACEALAYAHSRGVIHRDLKPANIMVGAFGEVYVMDWGLAKVLGREVRELETPSLEGEASSSHVIADLRHGPIPDSPLATGVGHVLGTPSYMAPEQARGKLDALGPHSDVYAMGAILYEWLAGAAPYANLERKLKAHELLARLLDGSPMPLRELARSSSHELIAICEKAMAREPADRYGGMLDLVEDLRAFQEGRPGTAWRDPPFRRAVKLVRRHPTAAIGVIALALAMAAGVAFVRMREVEASREELVEARDERRVYDEFQILSEVESALSADVEDEHWQERMRAEHVRRYADAARKVLESLRSFHVDASAAPSGEELANQVRGASSDLLREGLVQELLLLARFIGVSGIGEAAHWHHARTTTPDALAQWDAMLASNPELARVWPKLLPALRSLHGSSLGGACLEQYTRWLPDRSVRLELGGQSFDSVPASELDFVSFTIVQMNDAESSLPLLARAVRARPDSVWCQMRAARLALDRNESSTGLAHATAAVALWPRSASAHRLHGEALEQHGDGEGAIAAFERGLSINPRSLPLLTALGDVLTAQERFEEALDKQERALREAPDDPELLYNLGLALDRVGERSEDMAAGERAVEMFRRVTEFRPKWWDGFYRLGRALQIVMRLEESIAAFDAGLALHPKGRDLRVSKAESLAQLGRHDEAVELCLALLNDFPDEASGLDLFELLMQDPSAEARRAEYEQRLRAIRQR